MSARDLDFFFETLPVGDDPSMDAADPEFQSICDMANRGDIAGAAVRIERLVARGVYDLRLVTILFVDSFTENGWLGLSRALEAISSLLGANKDAFGPHARRDAQLDRRLAWSFERIAQLYAYHAAKNDTMFAGWDEGTTPESIERAIAHGKAVSMRLGELGYTEAGQRFGAISRMLAERAEVVRRAPIADASQQDQHEIASTNDTVVDRGRARSTATLAVTERFFELEARLAAFATLAERSDFERAAVVAHELLAELDAFDPRRYFPGLFADFYGVMSRDVDKLAAFDARQGAPRFEMLKQLLRVDLAKFLERP